MTTSQNVAIIVRYLSHRPLSESTRSGHDHKVACAKGIEIRYLVVKLEPGGSGRTSRNSDHLRIDSICQFTAMNVPVFCYAGSDFLLVHWSFGPSGWITIDLLTPHWLHSSYWHISGSSPTEQIIGEVMRYYSTPDLISSFHDFFIVV